VLYRRAVIEGALNGGAYAGRLPGGSPGPAAFLGEARFDGYFAVSMWPREDAAACLPPGLHLASRSEHASHPVVFVFGLQSETALLLGRRRWPTGFRYNELIVLVPFVQREGDERLCLHVPRMYAADDWATWTGNAYYGFNKVRAELAWFSDTLAVSQPVGGLVAEAGVANANASEWARRGDGAVAGFEAIWDLAKLPVTGRREDGSFVTSHFEWDLRSAFLRPTRAWVSFHAAIARGIAPRTCHAAPGGAFELRNMRWRLSWPMASTV